MIALKVIAILAFASAAFAGQDLDNALNSLECARKAFLVGAAGLPKLEPYVTIDQDISWSGDISIAKVEAVLSDVTIGGVPHWTVSSATQNSDDSDSTASFDFELTWVDPVQFNGTFDVKLTELFLTQEFKGDFAVATEGNKWTGSIKFVKGQDVTDTNILWTVGNVVASVSGLGDLEDTVESTIVDVVTKALNEDIIGNLVGDLVQTVLKSWYPDTIEEIFTWCQSNTL